MMDWGAKWEDFRLGAFSFLSLVTASPPNTTSNEQESNEQSNEQKQ